MTADYDEIVPGLDHSLCKADGLLFWHETPGHVTPPRRRDGKRRSIKAEIERLDGQGPAQTTLWEDMAQW